MNRFGSAREQVSDRYRVEELLGRGGMGEVYRAYDLRLRRFVALKMLSFGPAGAEDATLSRAQCERLVREAQSAAGLKHASIVTIFDVGDVDTTPYIAMELVEGKPLRARLRRAPPMQERVRWLGEIASGLAAAHRAGLVHRDVKPDNIMITDGGAVKILDFGIAKTTTDEAPHSAAGSVVGTPRYMAPEQASGLPVDARTDQFAWGLVGYELLSGRHPRDIRPGFSPATAWFDAAPPLEVDAPPEIAKAILRALERKPGDRFASMDEIASLLGERAVVATAPEKPKPTIAELDPTVTSPPTMGAPLPPAATPRRRRWPFAAVGAAALGAAGLAAVMHEPPDVVTPVAAPRVVSSVPELALSIAAPVAREAGVMIAPPAVTRDAEAESEIDRLKRNIRAALPARQAAFRALCGYDVVIEIDWASFGQDRIALETLSSNRGAERLVDAFKNVCQDDTNRASVRAKVQRIRAVNVPAKSDAKAFVGGGAFVAQLDWGSGYPSLTSEELAVVIVKAL